MNIQSISELTNDASVIRSLSAIPSYIEISKLIGRSSLYESKKIELHTLLTSICTELTLLSTAISKLNQETQSIRNEYVKRAGDTMTGTLIINPTSPQTTLALSASGNIDIRSDSIAIKKFGNMQEQVSIKSGQLRCQQDIDGCALTAKWG